MASARFEYDFVKLEGKDRDSYRQVIRERAEAGWRLVQVLAPGSGGLWASPNYMEVIFERKLE